jgi:hypothetical protein
VADFLEVAEKREKTLIRGKSRYRFPAANSSKSEERLDGIKNSFQKRKKACW